MRIRRMQRWAALAILALMLFGLRALVGAEEKADNASKPIPKAFEKIKEIGREAGKEISKAARNTASVVRKAVKAEKSTDSKPAE